MTFLLHLHFLQSSCWATVNSNWRDFVQLPVLALLCRQRDWTATKKKNVFLFFSRDPRFARFVTAVAPRQAAGQRKDGWCFLKRRYL